MSLQYLKDNHNNTTAIVIPISGGERITQTYQDIYLMLQTKTEATRKKKPSDYRGCLSSETADKLNTHIEQSRHEWNNDF